MKITILGEMADIAGFVAPHPLLIEHGIRDPIFSIDGARLAYRELDGFRRSRVPRNGWMQISFQAIIALAVARRLTGSTAGSDDIRLVSLWRNANE